MHVSGTSLQHSAPVYTRQQVVRAQQRQQPAMETHATIGASKPNPLTAKAARLADRQKAIPAEMSPLIADVQATAEELGYVDLSPTAIYKAYQNNQSLLADVRA